MRKYGNMLIRKYPGDIIFVEADDIKIEVGNSDYLLAAPTTRVQEDPEGMNRPIRLIAEKTGGYAMKNIRPYIAYLLAGSGNDISVSDTQGRPLAEIGYYRIEYSSPVDNIMNMAWELGTTFGRGNRFLKSYREFRKSYYYFYPKREDRNRIGQLRHQLNIIEGMFNVIHNEELLCLDFSVRFIDAECEREVLEYPYYKNGPPNAQAILDGDIRCAKVSTVRSEVNEYAWVPEDKNEFRTLINYNPVDRVINIWRPRRVAIWN